MSTRPPPSSPISDPSRGVVTLSPDLGDEARAICRLGGVPGRAWIEHMGGGLLAEGVLALRHLCAVDGPAAEGTDLFEMVSLHGGLGYRRR